MSTYLNSGLNTPKVSVFPPFVEEVDTTLPAFIGYTEKAEKASPGDLILVPMRISSIKEYELYFGKPFDNELELSVAVASIDQYVVIDCKEAPSVYLFYYCIKGYFENEGTPCYIISVGTYQTPPALTLSKDAVNENYGLLDGLNKLNDIADLSLVIIPEAVKLAEKDYATLVQATLNHCGTLGNRFAIFDLYHGNMAELDLSRNRGYFGSSFLSYGSVYYPFVKTTFNIHVNTNESNIKVKYLGETVTLGKLKASNRLLARFVRNESMKRFVEIPCASLVAAVYVTTDINKGVWKSPANLSLAGVSEPLIYVDIQWQESLYKDPENGKSINCLRSFPNRGILVWGARTLAGGDGIWQYVPVRRFFIMLKESLQRSTHWVIYEPNEPKTWKKVVTMLEDYLSQKWRRGALAGVSPHLAYYVKCGIGKTMTDQDLLDGKIRIEVGLAILRSGEFEVLQILHQMQIIGD